MSLLRKFKQEIQLGAYYDPVTDTIHGATPYSYTWYHENRHRKQAKRVQSIKAISTWSYIIGYSLSGGLLLANTLNGFARWDFIFTLSGIAWLPVTLLNTVLEIDAFIFGTWDWFRARAGGSR